jgi:two-component system, sensor histidine kinase RegB
MGRAGKDDLTCARRRSAPSCARRPSPMPGRQGDPLRHRPRPGRRRRQPVIRRRPEIIHGLRNLIQNAVDFAEAERLDRRRVDPELDHRPHHRRRPGLPPAGARPDRRPLRAPAPRRGRGPPAPRIRRHGPGPLHRQDAAGTVGAELTFANGRDPYTGEIADGDRLGAIVEAVWPRGDIVAEEAEAGRPLGRTSRSRPETGSESGLNRR